MNNLTGITNVVVALAILALWATLLTGAPAPMANALAVVLLVAFAWLTAFHLGRLLQVVLRWRENRRSRREFESLKKHLKARR